MIRAKRWACAGAAIFFCVCGCLSSAVAQKTGAATPAATGGATAAKRRAATTSSRRADVVRFETRVSATLDEAKAQKSFWGILVVDRETGETLYELNAGKFFAPASNAKIVTTSLAFATLGPEYKFRTTLETTGKIDAAGKLSGDLVLVGRGDPDLSNRVFPFAGKAEHDGPVEKILYEMADAAIAKGVKEIDGNVVADDSFYPSDPDPVGWNVGDLFFTYGAPVSAICFNDNTFTVEASPRAAVGAQAVMAVQPAAALGSFPQTIVTSPAADKPNFSVTRQPGTNFIFLRGMIPLGHASMKLDLAMSDSTSITAQALKQVFEARGVHVDGTATVHHALSPEIYNDQDIVLGPAPTPPSPDTQVLAEHFSPTLLETARMTNKVSQNLHAELLLRAVAYAKKGFGVTDAGIWTEKDFLASIGVTDGDVLLEDGSGLSGNDLVTPRALVQVLRYDAQQAWGENYITTFPVAGIDGTLETRMTKSVAQGLISAKTGSLSHVRSMSGFATTLRGEKLVFSNFGNNNAQPGHEATNVIDAIGVAMVETLGAAPPVASSSGAKHATTSSAAKKRSKPTQ